MPAPTPWTSTPEERKEVVRRMLVAGYARSTIVAELAKRWDCSRRSIRRYLQLVCEAIAKDYADQRVFRHAEVVAKLEEVHRKAMARGDLNAAARVLFTLSQIFGLFAATKVEHSGAVEVSRARAMTTAQRHARIRELAAKSGMVLVESPASPGDGDGSESLH